MGVVSKVGSGVTAFKEGQRVTSLGWLGHEGSGSWQQYINVPAERVVALPDGISDEAGAQFYVRLALFAAAVLVMEEGVGSMVALLMVLPAYAPNSTLCRTLPFSPV
jgi:NADPH2:quinone reductase